MKKVKVKKFKDAYLKKPIEESLEKLEQFLEQNSPSRLQQAAARQQKSGLITNQKPV